LDHFPLITSQFHAARSELRINMEQCCFDELGTEHMNGQTELRTL
jgi:hypothetical protein